jgi:NAD(P)-dependent dehydrogenase (short-subunit alcohol dehydrogenase family)
MTVDAVTPGLIETEMTSAVPPKVLEKLRATIPLRRMGRPEEVARVVRFVAADSSSHVTGHVWA